MKIWEPKPPETLWATPGLLQDCFTFYSKGRVSGRIILNLKQTMSDHKTCGWPGTQTEINIASTLQEEPLG